MLIATICYPSTNIYSRLKLITSILFPSRQCFLYLAVPLALEILAIPVLVGQGITTTNSSYADQSNPLGPANANKPGDLWNVDPYTGAASVRIRLAVNPVGGRDRTIPYLFQYNSSSTLHLSTPTEVGVLTSFGQQTSEWFNWQTPTAQFNPSNGPLGPWTSTYGTMLIRANPQIYSTNAVPPQAPQYNAAASSQCEFNGPFLFADENGAVHDLGLATTTMIEEGNTGSGCPPKVVNSSNATTIDGSELISTITGWTTSGPYGGIGTVGDFGDISFPDGSTLGIDRNGNMLGYGSNNTVQDSEGRSLAVSTIGGGSKDIAPGTYTVTTTGSTGGAQTYSITSIQISPSWSFSLPHPTISEASAYGGPSTSRINPPVGTVNVVSQINLPNNTAYSFSYDPVYGTLSRISFPEGGYVRFVWSIRNIGIGYSTNAVLVTAQSTLVVTDTYTSDAVTEERHSHYTYADMNLTSGELDTTVVAPDGSQTVYTSMPFASSSLYGASQKSYHETLRLIESKSGAVVRSIATVFGSGSNAMAAEPTQLVTTMFDGPSPIQQQVVYTYGAYSNVAEKDESDFYLCSTTSACTSTPPWLRKTTTIYYWQQFPAYKAAHIVKIPYQVIITDGTGRSLSEVQFGYDEFGLSGAAGILHHDDVNYPASRQTGRGNLTTTSHCNTFSGSTCSTWVSSYLHYDLTGQVVASVDANGNMTNYSYADSYTGGTPSGTTNGYVTQVQRPVTSGVAHVTNFKYFFNTGAPSTVTDENGQITQYTYADSLNRPTLVDRAQGTSAETETAYTYSGMTQVNVAQDQNGRGDGLLIISSVFDGLGNIVHATTPDGSVVDTAYDLMGRVASVSNPHNSGTSVTDGITSFAYDALGRKVTQCQPNNVPSGLPCAAGTNSLTWSYSGNAVISTDEAGKSKKSVSDGLGRLTDIYEDPSGKNIHTQYKYDALNNLTSAVQSGVGGETARTRLFTYDSLSQLTSAFNPETGTVEYGEWSHTCVGHGGCFDVYDGGGYDANGNVLERGDGRGTVSYTYDALNRVVTQISSDGSITGNYIYDQGTNGVGRLFHPQTNNSAGNGFYYDALGRLTDVSYVNPGSGGWQVGFHAVYDLAGNMTGLTYPDGRIIHQTWDGAGRLSQITDISNAGSPVTYISSLSYTPAGAQQGSVLGDGDIQIATNNQFNNRNQPCQSQFYSPVLAAAGQSGGIYNKGYYYQTNNSGIESSSCGTASGNNGNIAAIVNFSQTGWTQFFSYDSLNRLQTANRSDGGFNQTFSMDSFGNTLPPVPPQASMMYQIDPATNRLLRFTSDPNNSDFQYDASGNLNSVVDALGSHPYVYDALNKLLTINGGNTASYTYDALGQRVFKSTPGGMQSAMDYVFFNGQVMTEHTSDGNYRDFIYANGKNIASVARFDTRFHLSGINGATNDTNRWTVGEMPLPATPATIAPGDVLSFRIYQNNATTGISMGFSDNSNSDWYCGTCRTPVAANQWVTQNIPIGDMTNGAMDGKTISYFFMGNYPNSPNGQFDIMIADLALNHADGSVTPFPFSIGSFPWGGDITAVTNGQFVGEQVARDSGVIGAQALTRYFLGDHLGTAQFELSSGGWPVWQGQFTPYGQELDTQQTYNNYKFTGKERDTESGLDYFGARYYGSNMGRFMSPDHAEDETISVALPFAELSNPQTLNHYSYAGNNPLRYSDPDGHDYHVCADNGNGGQNCINLTDAQYAALSKQQNGQQGINLPGGMGGTITCGGNACGSASYFERGMQDETLGQMMMFLPIEKLVGPALGALGRIGESLLGRIGGEAAGKAASSILASGSKAAIRDALENGAVNEAQKGAVKRALARGKMTDTFTIEKLGDGSIKVTQDVAGRAGGHATYEKVVDGAGNTVPGSVMQRGYMPSGQEVHTDPKY